MHYRVRRTRFNPKLNNLKALLIGVYKTRIRLEIGEEGQNQKQIKVVGNLKSMQEVKRYLKNCLNKDLKDSGGTYSYARLAVTYSHIIQAGKGEFQFSDELVNIADKRLKEYDDSLRLDEK